MPQTTNRNCRLVVTRKPGEAIRIGPDIVVTVLKVSGDVVRISVEAPERVRILRAELQERRDEQYSDA